jgi:multisubunit Na+/H+ antiporter MnhB subunit
MKKGMSEIVQGISKIVTPFIFIFGVSLIFYGHVSPGGGFSGGIVIACSFLLIMLAFGKETLLKKFPLVMAETLDNVGTLGFLAVACLGFTAGIFFYNFIPKGQIFNLFSGGSIPISNLFIGLKIGFSLFAVIVMLAMSRLISDNGKVHYYESEEEIKK